MPLHNESLWKEIKQFTWTLLAIFVAWFASVSFNSVSAQNTKDINSVDERLKILELGYARQGEINESLKEAVKELKRFHTKP